MAQRKNFWRNVYERVSKTCLWINKAFSGEITGGKVEKIPGETSIRFFEEMPGGSPGEGTPENMAGGIYGAYLKEPLN